MDKIISAGAQIQKDPQNLFYSTFYLFIIGMLHMQSMDLEPTTSPSTPFFFYDEEPHQGRPFGPTLR